MEEMNVATTPQETTVETTETVAESTENTTQSTETTTEPFLSIKYNKEDVPLDKDKAIEYAQKGMNYDKAIERAKQESFQQARDNFIAEQGYSWNGKPITTEAQYKEALREQQLREEYSKRDLPEEVIDELIESRKFREQYKTEKQQFEAEQAKQKEYTDFLEFYKEEHGDYPKDGEIPNDVWIEKEKGGTLIDAFIRAERAKFKNQLNELNQAKEVEQKNEENRETSTGSITGKEKATDDFLSYDEVKANENNQSWINKNLDRIKKSMPHWKT